MLTPIAKTTAAALLGLALLFSTIRPVAAEAVGGSRSHYDTLSARAADTYRIRFYGDATARIAASGNGDIDIYEYDADGDLVAYDDDDDATPVCSWVPDSTQTYTIRIINTERYGVRYYMQTN